MVRTRVFSSNIGVAPGVFAAEVGAVEYPADISEAYDWAYEPADASETHDIEALPPIRRLWERDLDIPFRLEDEPMRCKPFSRRWRPLSGARSIAMGSVRGGDWSVGVISIGESTTESIDRASMLED
jgi:hypothetical protein